MHSPRVLTCGPCKVGTCFSFVRLGRLEADLDIWTPSMHIICSRTDLAPSIVSHITASSGRGVVVPCLAVSLFAGHRCGFSLCTA